MLYLSHTRIRPNPNWSSCERLHPIRMSLTQSAIAFDHGTQAGKVNAPNGIRMMLYSIAGRHSLRQTITGQGQFVG
jgi:hypothetical protein